MIVDLYAFIAKVAEEEKPYMKQGALILHQKGDKKVIVSVWAGAGIGANPTSRIAELSKKIEDLEKVNYDFLIRIKELENLTECPIIEGKEEEQNNMQRMIEMQQIEQRHKYQEYLKLKKKSLRCNNENLASKG
jgi:hypothetical protein